MPLPTPFLRQLLDTPGPSGFETAPARIWRAEAEKISDAVDVDVTGNSTATINPGGNPSVMLAGHIDEIGLMIVHVDDNGYLFFQTIGGWDSQVLVGQRVVIAGNDGPIAGVIGKNAIHLMKDEDREKVSEMSKKLSEDFVIIKDGEKPNMGLAAGILLLGAVMLVGGVAVLLKK